MICGLLLNKRSTGAEEGSVVLYLKKKFFMIGNELRTLKSLFFEFRYSIA
jgi:hypothetical protein